MSVPVVVYDACVLYSAQLRDLLMSLMLADLCCAYWSNAILDEWMRAASEKHSSVSVASITRCRDLMNQHAPDALVAGYESLVPTLSLPDPDDRHVLAAAIHGHARTIITFNLKTSPKTSSPRTESKPFTQTTLSTACCRMISPLFARWSELNDLN